MIFKIFLIVYSTIMHELLGFKLDIKHLLNRDEIKLVIPKLPNVFVAICYGTDQECDRLTFRWMVEIDYDRKLDNVRTLGKHNRLLYVPVNSFDYGQAFEVVLVAHDRMVKMQLFVQDEVISSEQFDNNGQTENIGPLTKDGLVYDIYNEINRIVDDITETKQLSSSYYMLDVAHHLMQKSILDSFQFFPENITCCKIMQIISKITVANTPLDVLLSCQEVILKQACNNLHKNLTDGVWKFVDVNIAALKTEKEQTAIDVNEFSVRLRRNYMRKFVTNLNNIIVKLQKVHKHQMKKMERGTAIRSLCTCYFKSNYSNTCCNVTIASIGRTNLTVLQMNYDPKFVLNKLQDPIIFTYVDSTVQKWNEPFLLKFKLDKKPTQIHNFSIVTSNNNSTNKLVYKFYMEKSGNVLSVHFINKNMHDLNSRMVAKQSYPSWRDLNAQSLHTIPRGKSSVLLNLNDSTGGFVWYFGIIISNRNQTETIDEPTADRMKTANESVDNVLQIQLFIPICERWDSFLDRWSLAKSKVNGIDITNDDITVSCLYPNGNRTTEYYTSEIKQPRFLFSGNSTPKSMPYVLEKNACFIIPITAGIIFLIYLIISLTLLARRVKVEKDINVLYDNNLNDVYHYLMIVHTGFYAGAGTTANVCFKLFGTFHDTPCHVFSGKYQPILQRGSEDWFILLTNSYLGSINKIQIWTDCYGIHPSWYCQKILLYDLNRRERWIFNINKWLSVEKCYLMHTEEPYVHGQRFQIAQGDSYLEQFSKKHVLIGCLNRPSCCKISTVTFGILMIMLALMLLLNGIPTFSIRDYIGLGHYQFKFIYLLYIIGSALVTLVLTSLFSQTCRRRWTIYTTCKQFLARNWMQLLCTISLAVLILFFTITLVSCGLAVNYYSSLTWLSLSAVTVLVYFIFDTVRVWLVTCCCAKIEFYTYEELLIRMDTVAIDCEKMNLLKKYGECGMRPLFKNLYTTVMNERKICIKREVAIYANKLKKYITSSLCYIAFYVILLLFVFVQTDDLGYYNHRFIKSLLLKKSYSSFQSSPSGILQSVENFSESLAEDKHHLLANEPFLRQVRVSNENGCVAKDQKDFTKKCLFQDSNRMMDKRNYDEGWKPSENAFDNLNSDINAMWLYRSDEAGAPPVTSRYDLLAKYPDGGYYLGIGNTTDSTKSIVSYLKDKKWLDLSTMAVFVEINLYNPNSQFFINGLMIVERSSTGTSTVVNAIVHSFKVHCNKAAPTLFVIYGIFVIATLLFGLALVNKLARRKERFCKPYNVLDLSIVVASSILIILFLYFCIVQRKHWNKYISKRELPSLRRIAYNNDLFNSAAAIVVFLATVRLTKLLTFGDSLCIHQLTLKLARTKLLTLIGLLALFTLMFSLWAHVAFGSYSQDFETIKKSFMALLCLNYRASFIKYVTSTRGASGPTFFSTNKILFALVIFMKIFITAMIIGVLLRAHQKAKVVVENINKCCKHIRFGFFKYIIIRYKVWRSRLKGRAVFYKLRAGQDDVYDEFVERTQNLENLIGKSPTRLYLVQAVSLQVLELLLEYSLSKNIKCNYKECVARILESLAVYVYCELAYCVRKCRCTRIKPKNPTCDIIQILCHLLKSQCCGCMVCPYYQNYYNRNRLVVIQWNRLLEKCLGCKKRNKWKRRTWCPKRVPPKRLHCVRNICQSECTYPPCGKI